MDQYGDHPLLCKLYKITRRHDNIVKLLTNEMDEANITYQVEPRNIYSFNKMRPANIKTDKLFNEEITWIDVGITSKQNKIFQDITDDYEINKI